MYQDSFLHILPDGLTWKFTIRDKDIDGKIFYVGYYININTDYYKKLSEADKNTQYGIEITDDDGQIVKYRGADKLKADIKSKFGYERLNSQK